MDRTDMTEMTEMTDKTDKTARIDSTDRTDRTDRDRLEALLNEIAAIGDCIGSMQHGINRYDTETSNAMGYLGARVKALSYEVDDVCRKLLEKK